MPPLAGAHSIDARASASGRQILGGARALPVACWSPRGGRASRARPCNKPEGNLNSKGPRQPEESADLGRARACQCPRAAAPPRLPP